MQSDFREDDYDGDEMEDMIDVGDAGYCEINEHYDWADNVHGWGCLDNLDETVSACEDCEGKLAPFLVDAALSRGFPHSEVRRRLEVQIEAGRFEPEMANRIVEVLASRWIEA